MLYSGCVVLQFIFCHSMETLQIKYMFVRTYLVWSSTQSRQVRFTLVQQKCLSKFRLLIICCPPCNVRLLIRWSPPYNVRLLIRWCPPYNVRLLIRWCPPYNVRLLIRWCPPYNVRLLIRYCPPYKVTD